MPALGGELVVLQFVLCLRSLSPSLFPPLVMNFADAVQTTADEIRKMADDRRAGGRERWVLPAANVFGFR